MSRFKSAFTMIELIVVLVAIAILAVYSVPNIKRDNRAEAVNHLLTMVRFTQNLALHDNRHSSDTPQWQRSFWRFEIYKCANDTGIFYMIGTDQDYNRYLNRGETATDPANGKFTFWDTRKECPKDSDDSFMEDVSPNIFLTQKYGIKSAEFSKCRIFKSSNYRPSYEIKHIGFDSFGRPHKSYTATYKPSHWGVTTEDCEITFTFIDETIEPFTIVVPNESGFPYLKENPNL